MSFVIAHPEVPARAAGQLNGVGWELASQNEAAGAATTMVPAVAADEASALTATQFSAHAVLYQAVNVHATAIHEMFTSIFGASATSYAATEAVNTIAVS
jgi:PE family protein